MGDHNRNWRGDCDDRIARDTRAYTIQVIVVGAIALALMVTAAVTFQNTRPAKVTRVIAYERHTCASETGFYRWHDGKVTCLYLNTWTGDER